jgi:hypothetical protein
MKIIVSVYIFIFLNFSCAYASSEFDYVGPKKSYSYSYCYGDNIFSYGIKSVYGDNIYKNIKYYGETKHSYDLYVKNNNVMIMGDHEGVLLSFEDVWSQCYHSMSTDGKKFVENYICLKKYEKINNFDVLIVIKEKDSVLLEEVYIKNVGLFISGGYSKDVGRDLDNYEFLCVIDGEELKNTNLRGIKPLIIDVLKKYEVRNFEIK